MALAHEYVAIYPSGTTDPISDNPQGDAGASYSATYTSMSGMEAGEDADYSGGDGTVLHVEIIPSDGSWNAAPDTTAVVFDGWKTDKAGDGSFIEVKTYGSARSSTGAFVATAYILQQAASTRNIIIDNDASSSNYLDITFDGVQFQSTSANASQNFMVRSGAYHNIIECRSCYFRQDAAQTNVYPLENSNADISFKNCIIDGGGEGVKSISVTVNSLYFYNCTVVGCNDGFEIDDTTTNIRYVNCALANNTDDLQDTMPSGYPNYCAMDEGSGEGTNTVDISGTWDSTCFVDHTTGDWRVQDALSPLHHSQNTYQSQTNDSEVPSTDMLGVARVDGDEDCGAFQFAADGGTEVTKDGALTSSGESSRHFAGARALSGEL